MSEERAARTQRLLAEARAKKNGGVLVQVTPFVPPPPVKRSRWRAWRPHLITAAVSAAASALGALATLAAAGML